MTLTKYSRIDALTLDPNRYTESLLSAARDVGIYDDETVMQIQGNLFCLLTERLEALTNGESCSVPAETAQALLSSVLYTIDQSLISHPTPDDAAERLSNGNTSALYKDGVRIIKRRLRASELQYQRSLTLFRSLPDSVMKTTAIDGIAGFFRGYHPEGFADTVPITADYPLYLDGNTIKDLRGVNFLARYLQGLITEAQFLSKFRADTLHAVLSSSDPLYRENPSNLYAPMLATAIGMALLHRPFPVWKFGLQGEDLTALVRMHEDGMLNEACLMEAAETVIDLLMLDDGCADYVRRSVPRLCDSIEICMRAGLPMRVFPCTDSAYRYASWENGNLSYRGGRMDASSFRALDYDLRTCTTAEEKTAMILSRVRGLEDICDLVSSDTGALDAEEKKHLLASLPMEARQVLTAMMGETDD